MLNAILESMVCIASCAFERTTMLAEVFCVISWQSAVRAGYCDAVFTRPWLSHVVLLRGHTVVLNFRLVACVICFITPPPSC